MTTSGPDLVLILSGVFTVGVVLGAYVTYKTMEKLGNLVGHPVGTCSTPASGPTVVVNIPEGAEALKQLTPLVPDAVIGPERSVLFWTVFHACLKDPNVYLEDGVDAAERAVAAVYGDPS